MIDELNHLQKNLKTTYEAFLSAKQERAQADNDCESLATQLPDACPEDTRLDNCYHRAYVAQTQFMAAADSYYAAYSDYTDLLDRIEETNPETIRIEPRVLLGLAG